MICQRKIYAFVVIWFSLPELLVYSGDATDDQISMEKKLRNYLLLNYEKTPPYINATKPLLINIYLFPLFLIDVDENEGKLAFNTWISLVWKNERQKWNPEEYADTKWFSFGSDELWTPDFMILNSIPAMENKPWIHTRTGVMNDGLAYWIILTTVRIRCSELFSEVVLKRCNLTLGVWLSESQKKNEYRLTGINTHYFENNHSVWEYTSSDISQHPSYKHMAILTMVLKRRFNSTKYVITGTRISAILLTLAMFWLPPNSHKKINLGCLSILLLLGLMLYLTSTVSNPSLLSSTASSVRTTLLIVSSALIIEIMILSISKLNDVLKPSPAVIRVLSGIVGRAIGVCPPVEFRIEGGISRLYEDREDETPQKLLSVEEEWFIIAMTLERILFVMYLIIMFAI